MLKEVQAAEGYIILFIDEIHTVVGAGATEGSMDACKLLVCLLLVVLTMLLLHIQYECVCGYLS